MKITRFAVVILAALALAAIPAAAQLGRVTGAVNNTLGGQASAQHGNSGLGVDLGSTTQGTLGAEAGDPFSGLGQAAGNTTDAAAQTTRESAQKTKKAAGQAEAKSKDTLDASAQKTEAASDSATQKAEGASVDANANASSSTSVQAGGKSASASSDTSAQAGAAAVNANSGAGKQTGMDRAETRGRKNAKANQAIDRNQARQDSNTHNPKN